MKALLKYNFTVLSAVILFYYPWTLQAESEKNSKTEILQQYQLKVSGLKCESCVPDVRKALKNVPGVRDARVTHFDKTGSSTVVEAVPGKVAGTQLVSALENDGFKAEVLSVGEPREVILPKESGFSFFGLFN